MLEDAKSKFEVEKIGSDVWYAVDDNENDEHYTVCATYQSLHGMTEYTVTDEDGNDVEGHKETEILAALSEYLDKNDN